jgi:glucoamylase
MARPIVLSNGELHVGINRFGLVHDFYFPYVGLENHAAGKSLRHRVGVWIDGQISWLDDGSWEFKFWYPQQALIGHTIAKNENLGVLLEFDDVVDAHMSAFMRNIHVVNLRNNDREIRLFMHQAFAIGDARSNTDTAQYLPDSHSVLHYRGRRAFIVSGEAGDMPFDQYTVGLFGIEGYEGSYRDADDGELSFSSVEHGRVDSVIRFKLNVKALSSTRVHYWIAAGTSMREAMYIHKQVREDGVLKRLHSTADWWQDWLRPAIHAAKKIDPEFQDNFIRSAMVIKSQIDKRGAVIASTAAELAEIAEDKDSAVKWRTAAGDIHAAAHKYLFNSDRQAFYKGVLVKDGHVEYNNTFDLSSIFGVFMFGLYPIDSEEVQATIQTLTRTFGVDNGAIGLPRYENDAYRRVSSNVTGNWWIISSLWLAQYYLEIDEPEKATKIIAWVQRHASHTGMLAEQLSPIDESPVSVEPLTWSHAEFLSALLDTIPKKGNKHVKE